MRQLVRQHRPSLRLGQKRQQGQSQDQVKSVESDQPEKRPLVRQGIRAPVDPHLRHRPHPHRRPQLVERREKSVGILPPDDGPVRYSLEAQQPAPPRPEDNPRKQCYPKPTGIAAEDAVDRPPKHPPHPHHDRKEVEQRRPDHEDDPPPEGTRALVRQPRVILGQPVLLLCIQNSL